VGQDQLTLSDSHTSVRDKWSLFRNSCAGVCHSYTGRDSHTLVRDSCLYEGHKLMYLCMTSWSVTRIHHIQWFVTHVHCSVTHICMNISHEQMYVSHELMYLYMTS